MKKEDIDKTEEGELEEVGATSVYDTKGVDWGDTDSNPGGWQKIQKGEDGKIILNQVKINRE